VTAYSISTAVPAVYSAKTVCDTVSAVYRWQLRERERERESCQSVESLSAESVLSTETIQLTERASRMNGYRERTQYVEDSPAVSSIRYLTQRGSV